MIKSSIIKLMIDSNTSNNKRESPTIENKCGQTATSDFLVQWEMEIDIYKIDI